MTTYRERAIEAYRATAQQNGLVELARAALAALGCDEAVVERVDVVADGGRVAAAAADGSARFVVAVASGSTTTSVLDDAGTRHPVASLEDVGRVLAGEGGGTRTRDGA